MQTHKLENWQKFPNVPRTCMDMLRTMLHLREDQELPEVLWVIMGIHRAMEARCGGPAEWSYRDLAAMVIESALLPSALKAESDFIRGSEIKIASMNIQARYWHPAPLGLHLVNAYGDVYLVTQDDIEAPDVAIKDSEINRHAEIGDRLEHLEKVPLKVANSILVKAATSVEEDEPAPV
jgi:hypothetical protein